MSPRPSTQERVDDGDNPISLLRLSIRAKRLEEAIKLNESQTEIRYLLFCVMRYSFCFFSNGLPNLFVDRAQRV